MVKKKIKIVTKGEKVPKKMDYFTMLATRRPTAMQKILDSVPKLPYSVPKGGLPGWGDIPLDRAIPYTRIPPKTICFTKGRMGANLYPQPKGAPFNNCPSPAPEYDAEFDPNLRTWMRRQKIHHDPPCHPLEPPCSQAQYNRHRKLLHRVWSKLAFIEIRRQDDEDRDKYMMWKIGEIRDRQRYNALKAKIRNEQMQKVMERQLEELRLKQEDNLARQQRAEARIIRCREMKIQRHRERIRKAREKAEQLRQKSEAGKEIARMKLIKTLRTMRITDNRVKRQLQANIYNREKKKLDEDARKWAALWKSQIERKKLKTDTMIAYTSDLQKAVAIDLKSKRHAKAWKDELLRSMQLANLKEFSDIEKKYVRGMKKELVNRWRDKLPHEYYQLMRKVKPNPSDSLVTEAVHSGINGRSPSMTSIQRASYWMDKWEFVPKQVRAAINTILGKVIVQVTIPPVIKILNEVKSRVSKMISRRILQLQNSGRRNVTNTKGKIKCIPRSPSQQELHHDLNTEKNATNEVDRSLGKLQRTLSQIIKDHIYKGYDPNLKEVTTLPRTVERQDEIQVVAAKLAVYVCHTRNKDITTSSILVRKTAEDMLREMVRNMKETETEEDQ